MQKFLLICFALFSMHAIAQERGAVKNGEFWGKSDAYLHKQAF